MPNSSRHLLDAVYTRLGYAEGDLLSAAEGPDEATAKVWSDKGDWLALAKRVGAEKVFFVDNYPVVVFAEQESEAPEDWFLSFNSVWCMARPQVLFLARQGELSVLNLTKQPARRGDTPGRDDRLLDVVRATADVQDRLNRYRRDQVESGRLFEDSRFGFDDRADRALVRDLERVRTALLEHGLPARQAHALIGRSIFIRYLEDRRVLSERFFRGVARGNLKWGTLLAQAKEAAPDAGGGVFYPWVLSNKAFTYALFAQLAKRFNGDMFPVDAEEEGTVTERHLRLLRGFLLGGRDQALFFFAYRFDIIPIELISSIYEKFYTLEATVRRRSEGSYYTPSALVDFVLAQTLTDELLATRPRVMDPACGSGIFLVEAFRRIVRYRVAKERRALTAEELRGILRDQIAGVDINPEAVRVAAFSLYLAMLHYLEPPDILEHRLPCLTYQPDRKKDPENDFDILLAEDAFRIDERVLDQDIRRRFGSGCASVVIGNPPWGKAKKSEGESDGGEAWCEARGFAVGYKERSQTFIHRTMDLLRDGGRAGLLVSTGVFFKRHEITRNFRKQWLEKATLRQVVNFAAVRNAFFQRPGAEESGAKEEGAVAPFASVIFDKLPPAADGGFHYWSAKETAFVRRVQAVILNLADMRVGEQQRYVDDDSLWKVYWWGGHRDEAFVKRLRLGKSFREVVDPDGDRMGTGFQEATKGEACAWLRKYREYPAPLFERYGALPEQQFEKPPKVVLFPRVESLYRGPRLLIKRGVGTDDLVQGKIAARFQTEPFCYRHSIYGVPADHLDENAAKVILGVLWSSLTRYFLFLTAQNWGLWHDDLRSEDIYNIPVRLPADSRQGRELAARIVGTVDELRALPESVEDGTLFTDGRLTRTQRLGRIKELEGALDEAVYALFELTEQERERIDEVCRLGLDLFYRGMKSSAVQPLDWPDSLRPVGRRQDLAQAAPKNEICRYLSTFLELWEPQLAGQGGRLRWRVVRPAGASTMLAAIFETEDLAKPLGDPQETDAQAWADLLRRLAESSRLPAGTQRLYIDGLIRIVTDQDIVIIKRNERRLWTSSAARDDAEATMLLLLHKYS